MSDEKLGIVVTVKDDATAHLKSIDKATQALSKTVTSAGSRIRAAFEFHVVGQAINEVERGIHDLATAIPDLIGRGQEWATTVEQISTVSGLSAQGASKLAGAQQLLTGSTQGVDTAMAMFSKNLQNQPKYLAALGISMKQVQGLNMDQTFALVRDRLSQVGSASQQASIAAGLFGRGWKTMGLILKETPGQFDAVIAKAQESGVVLTQAGLEAALAFRQAQNAIGLAITGIGSQVFGALSPVLTSLVNGISQAIRDNMSNIVSFVVSTVNTVAGLISGLTGISLSVISPEPKDVLTFSAWKKTLEQVTPASQQAATATKAHTSAIDGQIKAIDRQIAALNKANTLQQEREQQAQLVKDLTTARAQLSDLRGKTILAAGMTFAEAELARQKQAADIVAGEKSVSDARRAIRDNERQRAIQARQQELQDRRDALQAGLQAQQTAAAKQVAIAANTTSNLRAQWRAYVNSTKKANADLSHGISATLQQTARDAQRFGRQIAGTISDLFLGTPGPGVIDGPKGQETLRPGARQGGLIAALQNVGDFLGKLVNLLPGNTTAVAALGAAILGSKVLGGLPGGGGGVGFLPGPAAAAAIASLGFSLAVKSFVPRTPGYDRMSAQLNGRPGGVAGGFFGDTTAQLAGWISSLIGTPPAGHGYYNRNTGSTTMPSQGGNGTNPWTLLQRLSGGGWNPGGSWGTQFGGSGQTSWLRQLGAFPAGAGQTSGFGDLHSGQNLIWERYLGDGSPLAQIGQDTSDNTQFTSDNTSTIPGGISIGDWLAGALGVSDPNAGKVNDWNAGNLGAVINDLKNGLVLPAKVTNTSDIGKDVGSHLGKITIKGGNFSWPSVVKADLANISKHTSNLSGGIGFDLTYAGNTAAHWLKNIHDALSGSGTQQHNSAPAGNRTARSAAVMPRSVTVRLDPSATKSFLRGRSATSTLRPVPGL